MIEPKDLPGISCHSIKNPSVVFYDNKWHLFCTVRGKERSHAIVYLNFAKWEEAHQAPQHVLTMHSGYFCAPQVFYFRPHKRWYLICQAASSDWEPNYQPAFATTTTLTDPDGWTPLKPLFDQKPKNVQAWLDFWVICDDSKTHLFFTSLNGKMWRSETSMEKFPHGWSTPVVALEGDVFEASHTYRLRGKKQYLTMIEAQNGPGWRYFKAYMADRLEGPWKPLAATKEKTFASMNNVMQTNGRWTDNISHGELLRSGFDERLEVEPQQFQIVFQGVLDTNRRGKNYGEIPWRLGLLKPQSP